MYLFLKGHSFIYELENVMRSFVRDVSVVDGAPGKNDENLDYAYLRLTRTKDGQKLLCVVNIKRMQWCKGAALDVDADEKEQEHTLACMLYDLMGGIHRFFPQWGVITGVRPAKFAMSMLSLGISGEEAVAGLCELHRVSENKARFAVETAINGNRLARNNTPLSYSLYISIPFCPSRCSYCSFISKTVERDKGIIEPYLEKLCGELEHTAGIAGSLGLKLETVYIGGGTPTVLDVRQLKMLTDTVSANFLPLDAREYTVEAGRPDTVTKEKLEILKKAGISRISINPQTASDAVLRGIGRNHTAKDIERAFALARAAGFEQINADVIAGLPGDDAAGFEATMQWLLGLTPENITVHALTRKRSSHINEFGAAPSHDAAQMVEHARQRLKQAEYLPYYMYKQKGTVESLENTGYAKPGTECLYNVYMMDELHTVLACGAGAVTKLVDQGKPEIKRIYNYKYPQEYIAGHGTLIARKKVIEEFYESIV